MQIITRQESGSYILFEHYFKQKLRIGYLLSWTVDGRNIFQNIQVNLEEPWDYWNICMEWLTMYSYFMMSWQRGYLKQASFNINVRCLYIISMHHMEKNCCFILCWWLFILVYFWSSWKMVCCNSRKDITCELTGICTLVHVNNNFSDEWPFHFSRSG